MPRKEEELEAKTASPSGRFGRQYREMDKQLPDGTHDVLEGLVFYCDRRSTGDAVKTKIEDGGVGTCNQQD